MQEAPHGDEKPRSNPARSGITPRYPAPELRANLVPEMRHMLPRKLTRSPEIDDCIVRSIHSPVNNTKIGRIAGQSNRGHSVTSRQIWSLPGPPNSLSKDSLKKTASTEAAGCRINGALDAKKEILNKRLSNSCIRKKHNDDYIDPCRRHYSPPCCRAPGCHYVAGIRENVPAVHQLRKPANDGGF